MRKFIGAIAFLDSERQDRTTNVMDFELAADWFKSVEEFFQQEVMTGDYDGTEILVNVYEYNGRLGVYAPVEPSIYASFDSENLVTSKSIMNPWYM